MNGKRRGFKGVHFLAEQGSDDSGENITAATRGHAGIAGRVDEPAAVGCGGDAGFLGSEIDLGVDAWQAVEHLLEARLDSAWYQCDNGTWYSDRGSRGACASQHPLSDGGGTTPNPGTGHCYSGTLGRDMRVGACLQSRFDRD